MPLPSILGPSSTPWRLPVHSRHLAWLADCCVNYSYALYLLTDVNLCGRCGALEESGAVLWKCLLVADASFTVVADLPVWSADARALAGDVLGVRESGLQKRGRFWAVFLLCSCLRHGTFFFLVCYEMIAVPIYIFAAYISLYPIHPYARTLITMGGYCLQDALKTKRTQAQRAAAVYHTLQTGICYILQLLQHVRNSPRIPHVDQSNRILM